MIGKYGINIDQLVCFVADNASVNVSISKKLKTPLIGCWSHRLNLVVEGHIRPYKPLLNKVTEVMRYLRNFKQRTSLREVDGLMPVLSNDTRWSSVFLMDLRYFDITPWLNEDDEKLAPLLLNAEERLQFASCWTNSGSLNQSARSCSSVAT